MASLDRTLRKDLETTVKKARRVAEAGARKAVAQLGVGETEAPKHLSAEQRALRNRLRAHGRQLGDRRDPKTGMQETARLVQECAYEHWHRMLFARFLAETDLLIEPESGVAITLERCRNSPARRRQTGCELASDYAERMLPQIFRKDDPVLQIALPPETRSEMEDLLKGLPKAVFEADDSLGWVYQFWQADKKGGGQQVRGEDRRRRAAGGHPALHRGLHGPLPAAQHARRLVGRQGAGRQTRRWQRRLRARMRCAPPARSATSSGPICASSGTRLRMARRGRGVRRPAHSRVGRKRRRISRCSIPAWGLGTFSVFALPILVAFRMAEEGLSQPAAVDAVLRDNLFGLEIDPRCTQIAAFNLAFAAWRRGRPSSAAAAQSRLFGPRYRRHQGGMVEAGGEGGDGGRSGGEARPARRREEPANGRAWKSGSRTGLRRSTISSPRRRGLAA